MEIRDRHFFITGSGKRLGRQMAEHFLNAGARLSAHYRNSKKEVDELSRAFPGKVFPVRADFTKISEIESAASSAVARFGPVDCLINSASNFYPTPLGRVTEAQWEDLFSGNLKGQFFLCQALANEMKSRGGLIVNLCDVNGVRPIKSFAPYSCAKAGLLMLTRNLALELAPKVRVVSISPGAVLLPENYTPEQAERAVEKSLLKRLGSPADIVAAARFLVENDYLTGVDLAVDGGRNLF